jgi:DNA-binding beta-propeller fold protein YncE
MMTPNYKKLFITCESTNEVSIMDAYTDAILDSIRTGTKPQEIAFSQSKPYVFITCMEDAANTRPGCKGSVYVINYNTHEVVTVLYGDFYQPHGIAVDDRYGKIYIASSNSSTLGPAAHHATACDGNAGWYSVYDLNTLAPLNNKRYQVTVMPYSAATRFTTP